MFPSLLGKASTKRTPRGRKLITDEPKSLQTLPGLSECERQKSRMAQAGSSLAQGSSGSGSGIDGYGHDVARKGKPAICHMQALHRPVDLSGPYPQMAGMQGMWADVGRPR